MNEQEQELVKRYLRYVKKKRIIVFSIIFLFTSAGILFFAINFKNVNNNKPIINQEIIENQVNESVTNSITNTVSENTDEDVENVQVETATETKPVIEEPKKEVQETKPSTTTSSTKKEVEHSKPKPANKDFLFTDGYTMDNVTQIAQEYLKSSGYAGECIPLQDDEGIYLGMRVIFY